MMPLTLANAGEENTILKVGGSAEVKKHLEDLGFVAWGHGEYRVVARRERDRQGQGSPRCHQLKKWQEKSWFEQFFK